MPAYKHRNRAGRVMWAFMYDGPGSSRENRKRISGSGFSTKREAEDAERERRIEEQRKVELAKAGATIAGPLPRTLGMLLDEFFAQHVDEKLALKTIERYHEQAAYLDPELLKMAIAEVTPVHLSREWNRLLKSGGHSRKNRIPRPMSAKTVRNIAGVVSAAFSRAIRWGLVSTNPVTNSEMPRVKKHYGVALTSVQLETLFAAASGPWCIRVFLEVSAGTGARRGEVLALRWADIQDGRASIARSLSQTRRGLEFKSTKSERLRVVKLPESTLATLDGHRKLQEEFRHQFGSDYQKEDLIFANPDGSPLKPDSVTATVSRVIKMLKLPKGVSLHSLRHTHTSHLLAENVPLPVVAARLGHSSVSTTAQIYSHMIHGQDDEAAQVWEKYRHRNLPTKEAGSVQ